MNKCNIRDQRGGALLWVLGLLMILTIGVNTSWHYMHVTRDHQAAHSHESQARYLAESAVYHVLSELNSGKEQINIPETTFKESGVYNADQLEGSLENKKVFRCSGNYGVEKPYISEYTLKVIYEQNISGSWHLISMQELKP